MTIQQLEKLIDNRIKASNEKNKQLIRQQEFVADEQRKLELKIREYEKELTAEEIMLLKYLNSYCLLLDVREVIELKVVFIEAYNIENECILRKKVSF